MTSAQDAAPASEDEFRLIADSAPVLIWVTALDRTRTFVNRAYVDFGGLSYDEALVYDWRNILHPEDAVRIVEESVAGEASLQTFSLVARYRRFDGEWRWLYSVSRPRWDGDGQHCGFIGVAHDITEAKAAETELREREEQLSAFVNQTTAGFAQVDLEGRFTLVNERFCEIAGRTRDELLQLTMQQITHPDDLPRNVVLFDTAVRDGKSYNHEKRYMRPDGTVVWVSNSVAVIRKADGTPFGVLAISLDVTDRRRAEAALRRSEESVRLAMEGAGMATWELDLETMEGPWSANRFDLLGYPRPPALRGTFDQWLERVHPDDVTMARTALERCFREGRPFEIEYRIRRADTGEVRWLTSHGSRIEQQDRRPTRFVGVSFDVTERVRSDEALRAAEAEFRSSLERAVEERTAELHQSEEALRQAQKLEAVGQLTGGVAHDFNNLLMVVSAGLNLLERTDDPARREMLMSRMRESVTRGANLTQQLLAFSRKTPLSPEIVDVADHVGGMSDLLDRSLGGGVAVVIDLPEDLAPVLADQTALQLALLNLAVNARDAMGGSGTVTISALNGTPEDPQAPFVSIAVSDTGHGMSAEVQARIFEPFFTTKEIGKGSGLGLAQVHGFAEQTGGRIAVRSSPGEGTTFTLVLPQAEGEQRRISERTGFRAAAEMRARGDALLVEDDDEVAALSGEMLEHLGWQVTRVASAEAALGALADDRHIDLIFSDVMMPGGMNGVELAREVRKRRPDLPVVLTSGYSENVQLDIADVGVPLLPKPYNLDTLAAVLEMAQIGGREKVVG